MTELFNLNIDYITIPNPIATSAMAGTTNSGFLNRVASDAGIATIGGFSIDAATIAASKSIQAAGRLEFISDAPMELIRSELEQIAIPAAVVVNVRSATIEALMEAALIVKGAGGILEIDAHCQQEAMMDAGAGQALLFDADKLASWVSKIKKTGVVLSVKFRAGIADDAALCCKLEDAGADIVHIDAMIEGGGNNPAVIRNVRDATELFIIANNSICDFESAKDMFSHGADMVSVARAMVANTAVVPALVDAVTQFQQDTGWYNAPKH
ncbi:MAG: tRNA-dihydrouridine synthase, partial [Methanosarcinales archaeon]|nr:tRNA-dihydrouridine synthase [Methanosarcinales archaeon]